MTSTAKDQIEALTRAVHATDAGRRVGWSRAYSAEASKDELSRDLNEMRAERDMLYRYASFIHGYTRAVIDAFGGTEVHEPITRYQRQVGAVLDAAVEKAGRLAAEGPITAHAERSGVRAEREAARAEAKRRQRQSGRDFRAAREQERKLLMERFGIPNEAALYSYLERYGQ